MEKCQLIKQLKQIGLKQDDTVLIHSSLKKIDVDGLVIIDLLKEYFDQGLILMPAHTWSYIKEDNDVFDINLSSSNVGMLTELFRLSDGVYRSFHPTHSMCGYGNNAKEYLKGDEDSQTPCSPNGPWGRLSLVNAKILLIGCGLERATFIHAIEEKQNVPNRFTKDPINFILKDNDLILTRKVYRHYNLDYPHLSENYPRVEEELVENNILHYATFGNAFVKYFNACDLEEFLGAKLKLNINFFTD